MAIACPEYQLTIYDGTDKAILGTNDFGFKLIPNFVLGDLVATDIRIDLAINTLSFSEMSEKQVHYYAQNLSYMLGDTGILFEQNQDNRKVGLIHCKLYLPEYFKWRNTIGPTSIPGLTQGVADIWANRVMPGILPSAEVQRWILTRHFGTGLRWWLPYTILRIVGWKQFSALVQFLESRRRLMSFLSKLFRT